MSPLRKSLPLLLTSGCFYGAHILFMKKSLFFCWSFMGSFKVSVLALQASRALGAIWKSKVEGFSVKWGGKEKFNLGLFLKSMALLWSVCALILFAMMTGLVTGNVVLIGDNVSMSFDDIEAKFSKKFSFSSVLRPRIFCLDLHLLMAANV